MCHVLRIRRLDCVSISDTMDDSDSLVSSEPGSTIDVADPFLKFIHTSDILSQTTERTEEGSARKVAKNQRKRCADSQVKRTVC